MRNVDVPLTALMAVTGMLADGSTYEVAAVDGSPRFAWLVHRAVRARVFITEESRDDIEVTLRRVRARALLTAFG